MRKGFVILLSSVVGVLAADPLLALSEKGEGLIIGTVRPDFDEAGRLSVQAAGSEPVKLINVERIEP